MNGRAVVAGFIHRGTAQEDAQCALLMVEEDEAVLGVDVGGGVDGSALGWGGLNEAVGAEKAAASECSPGTVAAFEEEVCVVGVFGAVVGVQFGEVAVGALLHDVDNAADGGGAVEVAGAATDDFDGSDGELGELFPVDPAGEGVVERDVVFGDQGAAGGG